MRRLVVVLLFAAFSLAARAGWAQQAAAPAVTAPPLEVGAVAPDFSLPGATRYGVLRDPIKLSDFKGKTVVLAFFFKARTRG
ncbi:MAG: redoxin domain-containing protein [Gemmatimonadetes bacterium]|nr:redoxin domain-containing protein [Gemmatimonadota bacterium]